MTAVWGSIDTPEQALELLEKAVAERGEQHIEPSIDGVCSYVVDGRPSCIVGVALARFGVPVELLADHATAPMHNRSYVRHLFHVSDAASSVFFAAQYAQDAGRTWGEAVTAARSMVRAVHEDRAACAARQLVTA